MNVVEDLLGSVGAKQCKTLQTYYLVLPSNNKGFSKFKCYVKGYKYIDICDLYFLK